MKKVLAGIALLGLSFGVSALEMYSCYEYVDGKKVYAGIDVLDGNVNFAGSSSVSTLIAKAERDHLGMNVNSKRYLFSFSFIKNYDNTANVYATVMSFKDEKLSDREIFVCNKVK